MSKNSQVWIVPLKFAQIRTELMKNKVMHRLEIRDILTDKQKVYFNVMGPGKQHRGEKGLRPMPGHRGRDCFGPCQRNW